MLTSYHVLNDHSLFLIETIFKKTCFSSYDKLCNIFVTQAAREEEEKQMTLDQWKAMQAKKVIVTAVS